MSNASGNLHQSAKMMQAQAYFQTVVKQELQQLLSQQMDREVAVKQLLHRIVECMEPPEEYDIKRVMKQFQMQYDDAVRALIVKQEIGRLKRQGLDAFAAIEELTRKMQGKVKKESEKEEKKEDEQEEEEEEKKDEGVQRRRRSVEEEEEEDGSSPGVMEEEEEEEEDEEEEEEQDTTQASSPLHHLSSLSLCQRIDQVTISTSNGLPTVLSSNDLEGERISPPPPPPSPLLSPSLQSKETTIETPTNLPSKKRRATSSPTQPLPPILRRKSATSSSISRTPNRNQRYHGYKPRSPTFEFPKIKKQKIWNHNMTLKTPILVDSPSSPTAISSNTTVVDVERSLDASEALDNVEVVEKRHCRSLKRTSSHVSILPFEEETNEAVITKRHKPSI